MLFSQCLLFIFISSYIICSQLRLDLPYLVLCARFSGPEFHFEPLIVFALIHTYQSVKGVVSMRKPFIQSLLILSVFIASVHSSYSEELTVTALLGGSVVQPAGNNKHSRQRRGGTSSGSTRSPVTTLPAGLERGSEYILSKRSALTTILLNSNSTIKAAFSPPGGHQNPKR
jgi:hypothetical protein